MPRQRTKLAPKPRDAAAASFFPPARATTHRFLWAVSCSVVHYANLDGAFAVPLQWPFIQELIGCFHRGSPLGQQQELGPAARASLESKAASQLR
eukprot:scaffold48_cov311-Pinguiococcus_pyrenoidosus.AAC.9